MRIQKNSQTERFTRGEQFTRTSYAYNPSGQLILPNQLRLVAGRFGQAVMVEEGTTNLFLNSQNLEHSWWERGARVVIDPGLVSVPNTAFMADNIRLTAGTSNANFVRQGRMFNIVDNGQVFTLSCIARKNTHRFLALRAYTDAISFFSTFDFDTGTWSHIASGGSTVSAVSLGDGWWRLTETRALTITADNTLRVAGVMLALSSGGETFAPVGGESVFVTAMQIEQKPYATTWQLGGTPRAAETLTIPTAGVLNPNEGTIEFWAWLPHGPRSYLFAMNSWVNEHGLVIYGTHLGNANQLMHALIGDGTTFAMTPPIGVTRQQWHYFAARWTPTLLRFTVNGMTTQVARSGTHPILPTSASLGSGAHGTTHSNAFIDDLRISNRARSDAEILAGFNSGAPLPVDGDTTYKNEFDAPAILHRTRAVVLA